ncbi:MAG: twin transmembrane helix small protein [Methylococcales bacterium]|jgi:hypothetical protein|nr:twin transmembrane helix small protein [Methylococcales bacterium]MBT7445348.1 twin transmembrane helix small protein [Methylococcales bacterium]
MLATKYIVITVLVLIVASLASAMAYLVKDDSSSKRTVKALTVRISLSIALILFLVLAAYMGWIRPNSIVCDPAVDEYCPTSQERAEEKAKGTAKP